jgi:hypothetical protein
VDDHVDVSGLNKCSQLASPLFPRLVSFPLSEIELLASLGSNNLSSQHPATANGVISRAEVVPYGLDKSRIERQLLHTCW